ncbi:MAG: hypothetical protein ACRC6M_07635 [Microcystaceae cyanobacterium]
MCPIAILRHNQLIFNCDRPSRKIDSPKMIAVLKFNQQEDSDRAMKMIINARIV